MCAGGAAAGVCAGGTVVYSSMCDAWVGVTTIPFSKTCVLNFDSTVHINGAIAVYDGHLLHDDAPPYAHSGTLLAAKYLDIVPSTATILGSVTSTP